MEILKVYKLGSIYKILKIPYRDKKCFDKTYSNICNIKRLNNIIRAKTKISNLILCNDFKYFITQTINTDYDRGDLDLIRKSISNKIRKIRKKYNLDLKYILIAEKHKKGGYHLHGVLSSDFGQFLYINKNGYYSLNLFDYLGFSSISIIRDKIKISGYITKYITKDFINRETGSHLYFASQNLNREDLEISVEWNNAFDIIFDYENEYCSIKTTEDYNYIKNLKNRLQTIYKIDIN